MGTYNVSAEEIIDGIMHADDRIEFEDFLQGLEGDVSAEEMAEAWNILAKKHKWHDRLVSCDKKTYKKFIKFKEGINDGT